FGEGLFQRGPVAGTLNLAVSKLVVSFSVAALDGYSHLVAGLWCCAAHSTLEGSQSQHAFNFEPDIQENRIAGNGNDCALQLRGAIVRLALIALLKLRQQVAERLVGFCHGLGFWAIGVRHVSFCCWSGPLRLEFQGAVHAKRECLLYRSE